MRKIFGFASAIFSTPKKFRLDPRRDVGQTRRR
jgi:hypothetical protein